MPVDGLRVRDVEDTWGAPREGARDHAGQDIFAPPGTFVRSATPGVVWRIGNSTNGGNWVYVLGAGGRRYYYAHLGRVNRALREGQSVSTRTILGTVGNSGNASVTPAHLHFSVFTAYEPDASCRFLAINPLPLLRDR
ncbi:M23 family metallopeptidase [Deinococcus deserti]|nr:M23 family metallopeptidase [Deinococcus deserti]